MDVLELIRSLVKTNAARLIGYSASGAVALALLVANFFGVKLSAEFIAGLSGVVVVIATELIRQFVFSVNTTQAIADRAAETGNTDIGQPPSGELGNG